MAIIARDFDEKGNPTYFDAVFDKDFMLLYNGTQEETLKWLRSQIVSTDSYNVIPGKILLPMSVKEYFELYG